MDMNILFFDLECSNSFHGKGKVCEFGAILVDKNFNLIKEIAFPICPGQTPDCQFDLNFKDANGNLGWAYTPDYYMQCKELNEYYEQIQEVLEDDNNLVFGYAVNNDIIYLNDSIERYNLRKLHYIAYDLIPIIDQSIDQQIHGLENTFYAIYGDEGMKEITPHLSLDDARMTMLVAKYICQELDVDITELIEMYPKCEIDSLMYPEELKRKKEQRKIRRQIHKNCKEAWDHFCNQHLNKFATLTVNTSCVAISKHYLNDEDELNEIINQVLALELVPVKNKKDAHFFIVDPDKKEQVLHDERYANCNWVVLSKDEFLNVTSDDISSEIEYMLEQEANIQDSNDNQLINIFEQNVDNEIPSIIEVNFKKNNHLQSIPAIIKINYLRLVPSIIEINYDSSTKPKITINLHNEINNNQLITYNEFEIITFKKAN